MSRGGNWSLMLVLLFERSRGAGGFCWYAMWEGEAGCGGGVGILMDAMMLGR